MATRDHKYLEDMLSNRELPELPTSPTALDMFKTLALCRIADELHELNETLRNSNL